ncbi:MAG: hypothetical protein JO029_07445, partial [Candidatus Eremiobacteraeota bacterium]|nr:hypothetical protein [Candidatus Eremiobacteraeota bacterium]
GKAATGNDIDNPGTITSYDYNLIQNPITGNALAGTTTDDITGLDPGLGALTNNGGPTFTMADSPSSPGYEKIPFAASTCGNASGINVDQRGFARAPGPCDIGAFQYGASPAARHAPLVKPGPHHGHHHHPGNPNAKGVAQ